VADLSFGWGRSHSGVAELLPYGFDRPQALAGQLRALVGDWFRGSQIFEPYRNSSLMAADRALRLTARELSSSMTINRRSLTTVGLAPMLPQARCSTIR